MNIVGIIGIGLLAYILFMLFWLGYFIYKAALRNPGDFYFGNMCFLQLIDEEIAKVPLFKIIFRPFTWMLYFMRKL